MGIKPGIGTFGSVGRAQVLLENEISLSIKLVSRRRDEVLSNVLVDSCVDSGLDKTRRTNTRRRDGSQIITDCGNFSLDLKQLGFSASPFSSQTPRP